MSKYYKSAWDDKSRQRQRKMIMERKPWLKSTGAKTAEDKERSKMNALKISPELNKLIKEMKTLMKQQKEIQSVMEKM